MKIKFYISFFLLGNAFMAYSQIGTRVLSPVQLFPGGYMRVDNDLTFVNAHINTPRQSWSTSTVYVTDGLLVHGQSDASYVNGYMTKSGVGTFEFPVGNQEGDDLRPLNISETKEPIKLIIAYWKGDAGTNLDPSGGAHNLKAISNTGTPGKDQIALISEQGFWDWIPVTGTSEVTISVSIPDNTGKNGFPASSIRLVGWNTTTNKWENLSGSNAPDSNVEGTIVTGAVSDMSLYSAITIGATSAPLPVKLISFNASRESSQVHLKWRTSEELNTDYFEVQRSSNSKDWQTIGNQKAAGESKTLLEYSYTDVSPLSGNNYYRLRMVDNDETFAFSRIQSVEFEGDDNFLSMYPNPVSDILYVSNVKKQKLEQVSIHDMSGKQVYRSNIVLSDGIDVSRLGEGIYFVSLHVADGSSKAVKVCKILVHH